MIWEVFRQGQAGGEFVYCRDVHAPDRELAKQYAVVQHGRRKPTNALWVVPQQEINAVSTDESLGEPDADPESGEEADGDGGPGQRDDAVEAESETWVVFSPNRMGYHTECGTVTARSGAAASRRALAEFGGDDGTLWVVRSTEIGEVTAEDVSFGGTTDKSYRFAQTYNVDPVAEEVRTSEEEQVEAERRTRGDV
jgi:ring-1,2-phenylacetyl-CoA epoxidase subunit PaaB